MNNMNRIFLVLYLIFSLQFSFAQKPAITAADYSKWPVLGSEPIISNDGNYFACTIQMPNGDSEEIEHHVQSTKSNWQMKFSGAKLWPKITADNRYFIYQTNLDELKIVKLGGGIFKVIPDVSDFALANQASDTWLFYSLKHQPSTLILLNPRSGKQKEIQHVSNYWIHDNGRSVFILQEGAQQSAAQQSLVSVNFEDGKYKPIWVGFKAKDFVFDYKHSQLAFRTTDSIWYHKMSTDYASCIVHQHTNGIDSNLKIDALSNFSRDGKNLFFYSKEINKSSYQPNENLVEIWSYTDSIVRSQHREELNQFFCVADIDKSKVSRIEQAGETFSLFKPLNDSANTLGILTRQKVSSQEYWNAATQITRDLYSITDEKRKIHLAQKMGFPQISPLGDYLIYLDPDTKSFHGYKITTGVDYEFTKGLNVKWTNGILAWTKGGQSALVSDGNDLWLLDILGKIRPLNLTNGYGKKHNIVFSIAMENIADSVLDLNQKLILSAFNTETKDNGFYAAVLGKSRDPELLSMSQHIYKTNSVLADNDFTPIKAKDAQVYVVRRQAANEAPNYFITREFKTFKRMSYVQPQKEFNWYVAELHEWRSLNGDRLKGIMYKPEDFDPGKKYPVIFNIYERKSDGLNAYFKPEPLCNGCQINIPSYVSKGYLVFCPDIYKPKGNPMRGTYDAVISAASYVSSLQFVNKERMGIQGCSWGGIQIDYLVSRSNIFAAACSASGFANWINKYGSIDLSGLSSQAGMEYGQSDMQGSLWEKPDVYINNSAIFQVDKITTPILLMNNRLDDIIPYYDATAFFTGLRRMGKRSWLLSYPKGRHGVYGNEAEDFSLRMMQFFDHYLKDKPAPIWMLNVNTKDREKKTGLELDTLGRKPGRGILTAEAQKKVDSLMTIKQRTITLK